MGVTSEDGQSEWNGSEWVPYTSTGNNETIQPEITVNKSHKKECIFTLKTKMETRHIVIKQKGGFGIGFAMTIDNSEPMKLGAKGLLSKSVSKVGLFGFKSETIHNLASDLEDVLVTIYWKNGLASNSLYKVEFSKKDIHFDFVHDI
tara:strand:- start:294 stop:734 length:441 start_codon:yes stop_codon:yes gene_type:complete